MLTCQNFLKKQLLSEWWNRALGLEYLEHFFLLLSSGGLNLHLSSDSFQAMDYTGMWCLFVEALPLHSQQC